MIYRFKIVSEETDKFRREIEIDPEESFMALRNAILDSVGYTKDEISTFFICDDDWKRQDEVAIEDFGSSKPRHNTWTSSSLKKASRPKPQKYQETLIWISTAIPNSTKRKSETGSTT